MTVEDQHVDPYRDLGLTLRTAASLQTTIRHADMKVRILLGLQGGMAMAVLQQAPGLTDAASPALLAVAAVVAVAWACGLAVSGWHLLAAMAPRLAGPRRNNRFAFPVERPATANLRDQQDEAWDLVAALSVIAVSKHSRIRRALPAVVVAAVSAGSLLALAVLGSVAA